MQNRSDSCQNPAGRNINRVFRNLKLGSGFSRRKTFVVNHFEGLPRLLGEVFFHIFYGLFNQLKAVVRAIFDRSGVRNLESAFISGKIFFCSL